jgi:hypothetical protein
MILEVADIRTVAENAADIAEMAKASGHGFRLGDLDLFLNSDRVATR